MPPNRRCEILKEHLVLLYEDYEAAVSQIGRTLGAVDKKRLERQMEELEAKIEEWEEKVRLCELGAAEARAQQRRKHLEAYLPNINFTEVFEVMAQIAQETQDQQGGAALLMFQDALQMGGQWCIERMKRQLNDQTDDFRHYEIGMASGDRLDRWSIMHRLGSYLNCAPPQDAGASLLQLQEYVCALQETLGRSLQYGSIVLLEIRTWDHLSLPDVFLPWFVHEFWEPLVQRLPDIIQEKPLVTVICVIVALTPVNLENLDPALQCCNDNLDPAKILPLPLRSWQKAEIRDWLLRYSGLGKPPIEVDPTQIAAMAERVYLASNGGCPNPARHALLEAVEEYYNNHQGGVA